MSESKDLGIILVLFIVLILVFGSFFTIFITYNAKNMVCKKDQDVIVGDFDPLIDQKIFVKIDTIRFLEEKIDTTSDPDFYVKIYVEDKEFISPVWKDQTKLYDINWTISYDIADDLEFVDIRIELWDSDSGDKICDISPNDKTSSNPCAVNLVFDVKTGRWTGDDSLVDDPSGYGRLNGCDDNSFYRDEYDCELWFDIYLNDYDFDTIPYWTEKYVYKTDPEFCDLGYDYDEDYIPIEWEHRYGFNPMIWDDHENIDAEGDSINNLEEYLTESWGSNPTHKDLFLELDQMEIGPNGQGTHITKKTEEYLLDAYNPRNIVFHMDYNDEHDGGFLEYEKTSWIIYDRDKYNTFFLNNDPNNWKRGVFRYGIISRMHKPIVGLEFAGDGTIVDFCRPGLNCFILSSESLEKISKRKNIDLDFIFACGIFHELGHTMGIYMGNPNGCDNQLMRYPFTFQKILYRNYKSSMNYQYFHSLLDYSDGTNGKRDFDDWGNLDLSWFERIDDRTGNIQNTRKDTIIQPISDWIKEKRENLKDRFFPNPYT